LQLVQHQLQAQIEYREALYLAPVAKIIAAVHGAAPQLKSLMIVGHNPGLEDCATRLAREPVRRKERARHEALEEKFPTSALAILDFDVKRWRDVVEGTGKLVDFVRPRDL
jgi:phosphohistidine phosphatase